MPYPFDARTRERPGCRSTIIRRRLVPAVLIPLGTRDAARPLLLGEPWIQPVATSLDDPGEPRLLTPGMQKEMRRMLAQGSFDAVLVPRREENVA
jgi:hypothetical protein